MSLTLDDLYVPETDLGGGLIAIQADTGVGKTTLALQVAKEVPTAYMLLDPNTKYTKSQAPEGARLDFFRPTLPADPTPSDKQLWLEQVNLAWNHFLAAKPSHSHPEWGPYGAFVWDTATSLWKNESEIRVEQKVSAGRNPNREWQPLDYAIANAWMRSVADSRNRLRPESYVLLLLHEEPVYVQDPDNPNSSFKIAHPTRRTLDGWKNSFRDVQLAVRLYRKATWKDGKGVERKNVRFGTILKHAQLEGLIGVEEPEITWETIKGWL